MTLSKPSQRPTATSPASDLGNIEHAETVTSIGGPVRDSVLALTHLLSKQIGRVFDDEIEAKFGLSHSEWRVMLTVAANPGATAVEIIDAWAMDKMAVSRAVGRLEARNFVSRRQDHNDRRRYGLTLTNAGRKAYERILPHAMDRHRQLLACLSEAEMQRLRRLLQKMTAHALSLRQAPR